MLHMMRLIRRQDEAAGLTAPRMSALSVVVFGGPRTLGELAEMEQVAPPTMTRLIAGLERDGYVRRQRDTSDARVIRVHATPAGTRLMERGRSRRVSFLERTLATLPPDDVAALDRAAGILIRLYESRR